eukprot:640603-Pelagomonas_calceolata.AAC.2
MPKSFPGPEEPRPAWVGPKGGDSSSSLHWPNLSTLNVSNILKNILAVAPHGPKLPCMLDSLVLGAQLTICTHGSFAVMGH